MKVAYTEDALRDLDEIATYLALNYPTIARSVEKQFQTVIARISTWPESAEMIAERPGVRGVPLVRYPYKVFYRVIDQSIEILHIYHTARRGPWAEKAGESFPEEGET